jgi:hypothetical protein
MDSVGPCGSGGRDVYATSLPRHLFVVFVVFVVPARTLPRES